jgi:UDP-N-acetylglucosamine diphosphorylase / glucose-1-phosphate thymidylyltransferase / UDP-N-acetylgalactosamine diphosphorylase / glucosamine-1-phosphate N-acetyltransferase / galactosamine-1-phosphate N-acetyltransferase
MHNSNYLKNFLKYFPLLDTTLPWSIVQNLAEILKNRLAKLPDEFNFNDDVAIHKSATVEQHVIIKGPAIISANCFIGAHAYLRGGVFLGESVSVGPGCEIKTSIILDHSALAHFNFVGDSLIGSFVNMEAGSILANHHNDRDDKTIHMSIGEQSYVLDVTKFGSFIGDEVKIGANAVCSPGTFLASKTIVKRLALI